VLFLIHNINKLFGERVYPSRNKKDLPLFQLELKPKVPCDSLGRENVFKKTMELGFWGISGEQNCCIDV